MESRPGFDIPGSTRDRPIGMDGRLLTDRAATQVGTRLSRPRPMMRPGARVRCARAGRWAIFRFRLFSHDEQ
jgi:hypothetical protein